MRNRPGICYRIRMNPDARQTILPAPEWAWVVQPVIWAEYGLNEEGRITEKSVRGPVIVWGRKSGEGEDLPRLEAPTPSPLELETARLNMRPHLQAFERAAHRKVRHSVRWKTQSKSRIFAAGAVLRHCKRDGEYVPTRYLKKRFELIKSSVKPVLSDETKIGMKVMGFAALLREGWDEITISGTKIFKAIKYGLKYLMDFGICLNGDFFRPSLARIIKWIGGNKSLWTSVKRQLSQHRQLAALMRLRLRATDYRTHVLRHVRPVSRRARLPRPLYARPRPPSCPLAPPVA